MIDVAPSFVRFTTAFTKSALPCLNCGNSKTPIGPFQKIELALPTASAKIFADYGPLSNGSHPSGISAFLKYLAYDFAENSVPQTASTGK